MSWELCLWAEAAQIHALANDTVGPEPERGTLPQEHFRRLLDAGLLFEAIAFMSLAMPRFEAVAWAAGVLERHASTVPLDRWDRRALDTALRWVDEPTEAHRRAAETAAETAGQMAPERLLALSVFFSGGSISEPELDLVAPAAELAGRLASGAVLGSCHRLENPQGAIRKALELGEAVLVHGKKALRTAAEQLGL